MRQFDVPFELTIVSAHRTPRRMVEYASSAHKRGLRAIIAAAGTCRCTRPARTRPAPSIVRRSGWAWSAGAVGRTGGAAHLPGMVAALTPLPVIGVPVALKHLDGVDSLHSIVQMPRGVPVATVAIDNATNAALLAVRLLGAFIPRCVGRAAGGWPCADNASCLGRRPRRGRTGPLYQPARGHAGLPAANGRGSPCQGGPSGGGGLGGVQVILRAIPLPCHTHVDLAPRTDRHWPRARNGRSCGHHALPPPTGPLPPPPPPSRPAGGPRGRARRGRAVGVRGRRHAGGQAGGPKSMAATVICPRGLSLTDAAR